MQLNLYNNTNADQMYKESNFLRDKVDCSHAIYMERAEILWLKIHIVLVYNYKIN